MLDANPPVAGRFAFKERLSFTLKKSSLKALLEDLKEDRLSLKLITKSLKAQQEFTARDPSHEAVKMARQLAQVRSVADSLFSGLCRGCTCQCQTKHSAMTRLENRLRTAPEQKRRRLGNRPREPIAFSLLLPLSKAILQRASVMALLVDEDDPDLDR